MRALITGATGFIGGNFLPYFSSAVVLTRDVDRARELLGDVEIHAWQSDREPAPARAFEDVDVVVNLAGASVGEGRWTASRKRVLRESRILLTRNLVQGMRQARRRPRVLISSSAVGYYGTRGEELLDERSGPGEGFLADLCVDWEKEAMAGTDLGVRVVILRTALVLGRDAPALTRLLTVFRLALGARLGSGRQWMSWIHLEDLMQLTLHAIATDRIQGAVNASSPEPIRNADFTRTLAAVVKRPAILWAPKFGLRVLLGEFADALLASQRAVPKVALDSGFHFRHEDLRSALTEAAW